MKVKTGIDRVKRRSRLRSERLAKRVLKIMTNSSCGKKTFVRWEFRFKKCSATSGTAVCCLKLQLLHLLLAIPGLDNSTLFFAFDTRIQCFICEISVSVSWTGVQSRKLGHTIGFHAAWPEHRRSSVAKHDIVKEAASEWVGRRCTLQPSPLFKKSAHLPCADWKLTLRDCWIIKNETKKTYSFSPLRNLFTT